MTAVGVAGYLLYLGEHILTLISTVVFGKLIVFHFVMEYFDRRSAATLATEKGGSCTCSGRLQN